MPSEAGDSDLENGHTPPAHAPGRQVGADRVPWLMPRSLPWSPPLRPLLRGLSLPRAPERARAPGGCRARVQDDMRCVVTTRAWVPLGRLSRGVPCSASREGAGLGSRLLEHRHVQDLVLETC